MSADDARKDIMALGDAVSATGGGSAELARMSQNLQQIKNTGKATAMDMKQFAMAGIDLYGLMAESTGKSVAELQEMDITYDMVSEALAHASEEGGRFYGAMEAQSQTFNGRLSTLSDNWTAFLGNLTGSLFDTLTAEGGPMSMIIGWVDELNTAVTEHGVEGAIQALGGIFAAALQWILEQTPTVLETGGQLILSLLQGLGEHSAEIGATVANIVTSVVNFLVEHGPEILQAGGQILAGLIQGILSKLPELALSLLSLIGTAIGVLVENIGKFIGAGGQFVGGLVQGFVKGAAWLLATLVDIIVRCVAYIGDKVGQFISAGAQLIWGIVSGIWSKAGEVWTALTEPLRNAWDSITSTNWLDLGWNIISGIAQGIWNAAGQIWDALIGAISSAWNGALRWLGIGSPSKKARREIGQWIPAGIGVGIEDDDTAEKAMQDKAQSIIDIAQAALGQASWAIGDVSHATNNIMDARLEASWTGESTTIIELDGHELARASAPYLDEQLAFEGV